MEQIYGTGKEGERERERGRWGERERERERERNGGVAGPLPVHADAI